MKVRAPGKLILSGEHAVVYGMPALAMAVNRYAEAEAVSQRLPILSFDCSDLAYQRALQFASLERLKEKIKYKYRRFLRGEYKIRDVLKKPVELAQFALSLFFEMQNIRLTHGVKIKIQSNIPIGCGMGSSAAIILSVMYAIAQHLELTLSPDFFFRLGLEVENMQHGHSSGLDLRISQHGGCSFLEEDKIFSRNIPDFPLYLVNTGKPLCSTGECVSQVAPFFRQGSCGEDFAVVTQAMDRAWQENNYKAFQDAIYRNHILLTNIGVVPEPVQRFAAEVRTESGAAKICGAGAVTGDYAGVVLVVTEDIAALTQLCARYRYMLIPISVESRGVHVI